MQKGFSAMSTLQLPEGCGYDLFKVGLWLWVKDQLRAFAFDTILSSRNLSLCWKSPTEDTLDAEHCTTTSQRAFAQTLSG